MKRILILSLMCLLAACGDEPATTPSKVSQPLPKFQKGQIVYILGEYPGYVKDLSYSDSVYIYTLTTCNSGSASDYLWTEPMLQETKKDGYSPVSVINRDTTYHEQLVDAHDNTLTDQQQWVDYAFKNTQVELAGYLQEAHGGIEVNDNYSSKGVYWRLKAIDSVLHQDIFYISANLKAGKYPSGK